MSWNPVASSIDLMTLLYPPRHISRTVKSSFLIPPPPPELSNQNHPLACMIHTNTRFLLFFSSSCVFEGMPLPSWIRCLICLAFLFSSIPREPAFKTQTIDQHCLPFSNEAELFRCSCSDKKGRKYNLASLANNDGHPRFVKLVFFFKIRDDFLERTRFHKWILPKNKPSRQRSTSKENNKQSQRKKN